MKWKLYTALCLSCTLWIACQPPMPGESVSVSGTINAQAVGKWAPQAQSVNEAYTVVAQSRQTGEIYRATTDATGAFQLDLPASEANSTFIFSILDQNGRAMGPLVLGEDGDNGVTGVNLAGQNESLGDIVLPEDPTVAPLQPGSGATLTGRINAELFTRLNADGVPVGVPNVGKGDDSLLDGTPEFDGLDRDQDGLIDVVDADDDGDGIVDDFDPDSTTQDGGPIYSFMNLKIGPEEAPTYYSGTAAAINARLATDTVITFGVNDDAFPGKTTTAVRALTSPAPAYMALMQKVTDGPGGLTYAPWSDTGYDFDELDDGWGAFVIPGEVMNAGDLFTVEISFDDGSTQFVSQMVNYVFKNIPKLIRYGSAGNLTDFDVNSSTVNGTPEKPITFDGTKDLVLVFEPPVDETGTAITQLDYAFEIFYHDATGAQLDVDGDATWTTAIPNWTPERYELLASDLTLVGGTYTATLPKEIFPDTVTTDGGGNSAVDCYKIDIAPQKNGNNAAIMLAYKKN